MIDIKQVGNPASQRQAKVVRAEIEDLKAEAKALQESALRKLKIAAEKEAVCLDLETDGMAPQSKARYIRFKKPTEQK
jgi:hypothetical protein